MAAPALAALGNGCPRHSAGRVIFGPLKALRSRFTSIYFRICKHSTLATGAYQARFYKALRSSGGSRCSPRRREIALGPSKPGDKNVICHYGRKTSPHAYTCRDCQREFYLQCVEVKTPTKGQEIVCPNCGGDNLSSRSSP